MDVLHGECPFLTQHVVQLVWCHTHLLMLQMVCLKSAREGVGLQSPASEGVVGLHLTGPNAGEVMQGFAVAIK